MLAHKLCYKPEIASRFYFACNHCWLKAFWETFVTMGHTPSLSISNTVHLYMKEMWFYIWCDYDYDIYVFINDSWMVFHIYQINDKLQAWDCCKVFFSFLFFHDLTLYVIIVAEGILGEIMNYSTFTSTWISNILHSYMNKTWFDYDYDIYVFIYDSGMVLHIYHINNKLQYLWHH